MGVFPVPRSPHLLCPPWTTSARYPSPKTRMRSQGHHFSRRSLSTPGPEGPGAGGGKRMYREPKDSPVHPPPRRRSGTSGSLPVPKGTDDKPEAPLLKEKPPTPGPGGPGEGVGWVGVNVLATQGSPAHPTPPWQTSRCREISLPHLRHCSLGKASLLTPLTTSVLPIKYVK